ncbi:hypothetical protein B0H16DRAFT_1478064 [Mycena metata]|uniref:Uncharacterized protein n=1 Tax=Mycena metata TaxID=1033252 RepID=A0AAD7H8B2_9AGAR|nr:hypothetical protein B0H16DRAFT_1478064 [Mycena metata]
MSGTLDIWLAQGSALSLFLYPTLLEDRPLEFLMCAQLLSESRGRTSHLSHVCAAVTTQTLQHGGPPYESEWRLRTITAIWGLGGLYLGKAAPQADLCIAPFMVRLGNCYFHAGKGSLCERPVCDIVSHGLVRLAQCNRNDNPRLKKVFRLCQR